MQISIMYWNIWLDNQVNGKDGASPLLSELEKLINRYAPDCIGLNEVMQHRQADSPFILDFLNKLGYKYSYFAPASPWNDDWLIGAAVASKYPLESINEVVLSDDTPAARRGYEGQTVKAITAKIILPKKSVNIIVAHPLYMRPYTKQAHFAATKKLQELMNSDEFSKATILGGDFNESTRWPKSFYKAVSQKLNLATGGLLNPTWSHNSYTWTPLRLNLDQIYWAKDGLLKLNNFEVIKSRLSDHRPLIATFKIL